MRPGIVFPGGDAEHEVARLIELLHETGQRLEELTADEVDTVADSDGHTFVLRRAQELLRQIEASKQAAILDALPANVALLDSQGIIISMNAAWLRFATDNAMQGPNFGVGLDYLRGCDIAGAAGQADPGHAAAGIRSVLDRSAREFTMEYPCHSPSQQRWFRLMVAPLAETGSKGAVVLHVEITQAHLAEEGRRASELRFRSLIRNIELFSVMLGRAGEVTYCNEHLLSLTGWNLEEVLGQDWFDLFVPPEARKSRQEFGALLQNLPEAWHRESDIMTRSGERRRVRWSNSVMRSSAGEVIGTASIGADITEEHRAQAKLKRLNRVYAMLSQINALIVRVHDRQELFDEACRIAVEAGAFAMAWVGVIDAQTLDGKVVASHGADPGYMDQIRLTVREDTPESDRPSCRAVRLLQPVISNDIETDPTIVAAIRDDLLRAGRKSLGCFPLTVDGRAEGVMCLFASEAGGFDDEEVRMLVELTDHISFALDHLAKAEKLDYLAYYDVLTGLANRTLFQGRLAQWMRSAGVAGHKLALYILDVERFKSINDTLGQAAGDALLRQVAGWLTHSVDDPHLLARVGADQFAVVIPEVHQVEDVARQLEKAMTSFLDHPFPLKDSIFRVSARVGVALFPEDGADAATVFKNAEAALKKAKAGGERYLFYTQKMNDMVAGRLSLENQLRRALENEEFVLHYQPKVSLASGKITSAEALIRWNDPASGLVPPGKFIPVLEETGLIYVVGRWALRKAIADYLGWRAAGLAAPRIAVNVSPLQLRSRGFVAEIAQTIGVDPAASGGLELEITESLIMEDALHSIATLQAVRAMGVTVAIDDFGTGFSSLSYLSKLPVDTLKIDRSFVVEMTAGPEGLALVSTIIALAHSLKLKVVAEGVETEEQSQLLRLLDCDEMQGFLFSKAVPASDFRERFLLSG